MIYSANIPHGCDITDFIMHMMSYNYKYIHALTHIYVYIYIIILYVCVGGQDYSSLNDSIVFSGSKISEQVSINTNSDHLLEQPESFRVSLSHSEGENVLLLPSQSTIWIKDNNSMYSKYCDTLECMMCLICCIQKHAHLSLLKLLEHNCLFFKADNDFFMI